MEKQERETLNIEELRLELIRIIKHDPISFSDLARRIGLKSPLTISNFVYGKKIPYFKNITLIENWIEKGQFNFNNQEKNEITKKD